MNSREIVKNIINHRPADRIAFDFSQNRTDIIGVNMCSLQKDKNIDKKFFEWNSEPELLSQVKNFKGEVRYDVFGNIYGRLNGVTKGECVKGALYDWENITTFKLPKIDKEHIKSIDIQKLQASDKYVLATSNFAVFSIIRDARLIENALMDVILEEDNVTLFLDMILERNLELIELIKDSGVDGLIFYDDWGAQDRTFISPAIFRDLFKPIYKAVADKLHEHTMHLFVHSCGYNYAFMEDFIDAGIDVLQFDQLGSYGYEKMAQEFGGRVSFWSPLDIQLTLPTGDKEGIEREALRMITAFKGKGSLILKDYPSYADIGVCEQWATWARDVFMANIDKN